MGLSGVVGWADTSVLSGVPEYEWFHGCGVTSAGMMMGYWDGQPGYGNLFTYDGGDASTQWGNTDGSTGVYHMISSKEHNDSTFNQDNCTHTNASNCLGCFTHTDPVVGGTYYADLPVGLRLYADWDDPTTGADESYDFIADYSILYHPDWDPAEEPGCFTFEFLKTEIDQGRPLLLGASLDGAGHGVVAYGYQDNPGTDDDWYAVRDTWVDGDSDGVYGVTAKVEDSTEWWLWETPQSGDVFGERYYISQATYFYPNPGGSVSDAGSNDSFGTAQPISSTEIVIGAVDSPADQDWYSFFLNAGDCLTATTSTDYSVLSTSTVDTRLYLYNPDGTLRVSNDNFYTDSLMPHLWWEAEIAGDWRLKVDGVDSSTGSYYLSMINQPIPEPGTLLLFATALPAIAIGLRRRRRC